MLGKPHNVCGVSGAGMNLDFGTYPASASVCTPLLGAGLSKPWLAAGRAPSGRFSINLTADEVIANQSEASVFPNQ